MATPLGNSLDTDLIQLKWQHIRSIEALQCVERENVNLKEVIAKKLAAEEAGSKKDGETIRTLKHFIKLYKENNLKLKEDFKRVKLSISQDIKVSIHNQELLKLCFQRLFSTLQKRESELLKSNESQSSLSAQLADAAKSQHNQINSQSNELQEAKSKINDLLSQLSTLRNEKEKAKSENQTLKEKLEDQVSQLEKLSSRNESLNADINKLKKSFHEKESEKSSQILNLQNYQAEMKEDYEKILNQLNFENQFLRETVSDLEEQVKKLSLSLVGNKSHFAKYIEVKTENVTLQSKLDSILNSSSGVKPVIKPKSGRLPSQLHKEKAREENVEYEKDREKDADSLLKAMESVRDQSSQSIKIVPAPAPAIPYGSSFTNHRSIFNTGLSVVGSSHSNADSNSGNPIKLSAKARTHNPILAGASSSSSNNLLQTPSNDQQQGQGQGSGRGAGSDRISVPLPQSLAASQSGRFKPGSGAGSGSALGNDSIHLDSSKDILAVDEGGGGRSSHSGSSNKLNSPSNSTSIKKSLRVFRNNIVSQFDGPTPATGADSAVAVGNISASTQRTGGGNFSSRSQPPFQTSTSNSGTAARDRVLI